jgi:hypothetical protein
VAVALPAAPTHGQCGGPFIELFPGSGLPGTEVSVVGQRFDAGKYVDILYEGVIVATGRTDISGDFTLTFDIPEGCRGPYNVRAKVGANAGYDIADAHFTIRPGLTVNPQKGAPGTNVTVKGHGFAEEEQAIELVYYRNGSYETMERNIAANSKGSWERSFQIPASARGEHSIDAEGAQSKFYQVEDATFRITAEITIDESSGIAGDTITMTGRRFGANENNIRILFDGQPLVTDIKASSKGEWQETFDVPEMPTGTYSLTAEGEYTDKEDIEGLLFRIEPRIELSAYEGPLGMEVTITGIGFAADRSVTIMYDTIQVGNSTTSDQGGFEATFSVPESKHGEHKVIAGYSGQNAARTTFTVESNPPPVPTLISPSDGSRLGFMSDVTPTFDWSQVSDDSGVQYSLQVATTRNVTAAGEFADPTISVAGLAETSYTANEPLPNGTYYWIVQAEDGAANEGEWSEVHSFRVGFMPRWGFIAAIVGGVVLFLLLIRALLIRRSIFSDDW